MACRYLDSFDTYTTLAERWTTPNGCEINAAAARTCIAGMRYSGSAQSVCTTTLNAQGTWIIGFAFRITTMAGYTLARTLDAANLQGTLALNATGTLTVSGGAVTATSILTLLANVWYYIEFKHIIANAAGTLEVRVNGAVWATVAGDTQTTGNATADQISLNTPAGASTGAHYDDLYIFDGTGAINNDYAGEVQIEYLACNADGNSEQWTPSAGSNFQNVDEAAPDDDTTYNSTSTEGNKDTFGMANISIAAATIPAIQVIIRARKESAGTANIQRVYRSGVSENNGASFNPSTSYATQLEIMETDPIALGAWTVTNLNAAEMGYAAVA